MKLILLGTRAFQILCAAVVLGLSVHLYGKVEYVQDVCDAYKTKCHLGGLLASIGYCAFVGAWGLLSALLGIAATFIEAIPFFIISGVDSFGAVAFLAGGIRLAVLLKPQSCPSGDDYGNFCDKIKADCAFLFLGFLVTAGLLVMGFMNQRRGKSVGGV